MAPIPDKITENPSRQCPEIADIETPPVNITVESEGSGSEDEQSHSGYQLLPQEPSNIEEDAGDATPQESDLDTAITQTLNQVQYPAIGNSFPEALPDSEVLERSAVWKKPPPIQSMSSDEAEAIKSAMRGIKLPACAAPDWAKTVSDDELIQKLYSKLNIPPPSSVSQAALQTCSTVGTQSTSHTLSNNEFQPCSSASDGNVADKASSVTCGAKCGIKCENLKSDKVKENEEST